MLNRRNLFKFAGVSIAATQVKAEPLKEEFNPGERGLFMVRNTTKNWFAGTFYIGNPEFNNDRIEYHYTETEYRVPPWGYTPDPKWYAPIYERSVVEVWVKDPCWKSFKITPTWGYQKGFYSPDLFLWNGKEILRA